MTMYIGFISFVISRSHFCVYDERAVTEITSTFTDEESAIEWVKSHGAQFEDRRSDSSAVVAENTDDDGKTFFVVKIDEVGTKQRVRVASFHGYYAE